MKHIVCLILITGLLASCEFDPVSPTLTDADVELFNEAVTLQGSTTLKWEGAVFNRSNFNVQVAVKVEFKNPDDVVFFTTSEELVTVPPQATSTFEVEMLNTDLPTLVFSSIKDWNMSKRLVSWRQ